MSPEFVTAVRYLLGRGWIAEPAGCLHDEASGVAINWDWELDGAEAATVAPPGAEWRLTVEDKVDNGRSTSATRIGWREVRNDIVHSVPEAIDVLVGLDLLPITMSSLYQAGALCAWQNAGAVVPA